MKKNMTFLIILLTASSLTFLVGRDFRVSQIPHGSEFGCNGCHTSGGGTPRNPFGQDVETRVTAGGNENFWGPDLAALESDGDGFTNGEELQDPNGDWTPGSPLPGDAMLATHPGDPNDFPAVTSVDEFAKLPNQFSLGNNYPNPFNPTTRINFTIPQNANVKLNIYNSLGELVRNLEDKFFSPGSYSTLWNGKDNFGYQVNSGVYIYRLITDNFVETKRMVMVK